MALLDDRDLADLRVRDAFYRHLGGMSFSGAPLRLLLPRRARAALAHPGDVPLALGWARRVLGRAGGLQHGQTSSDPRIRATQERLRACASTMAHPETGQLVPACVQHAVLDPAENQALRRRLPLVERP